MGESPLSSALGGMLNALNGTKTFSEWKNDVANRDLPEHFSEFLRLWMPFVTSTIFRDAHADEVIWDLVPEIHEISARECVVTVVGFWYPDGQLTFPAVTAQNTSYLQPIVLRHGQTIRDAYIRKGGKWITILKVQGNIRPYDAPNFKWSVPSEIKEPISEEDRIFPSRVTLSVYTVRESPDPKTIQQWLWSKWKHRNKAKPF